MNIEQHKLILAAIKAGNVRNGVDFDAQMVTDWYNQCHNTEIDVSVIAEHLKNCPLPRRRLNPKEQWQWYKKTGYQVRTLYQKQQTGKRAYLDNGSKKQRRYRHERVRYDRVADEHERQQDEERRKQESGEWYDESIILEGWRNE